MPTDKQPRAEPQQPSGKVPPSSKAASEPMADSASEASRNDQEKTEPYTERKDIESGAKKPKPNSEAEAGDLDESEREVKPNSKVKNQS